MKTNLADLSRVYRDHLNRPGRVSSEPCPDIEALARCVMGELPRYDRDRIVEHAASCSACAEALKQILTLSDQTEKASAELAAAEARRRPGALSNAGPLWKKPAFWPVFAVSSGLVLILALIVLAPGYRNLPSTRSASGEGVVLLSPESGAELAKAGLVLRWQGLPKARSYRVELFDSSFRLIWRSGGLDGTESALPDEAVRKLIPGQRYYWAVTALTEGRREIRSELAEFALGK